MEWMPIETAPKDGTPVLIFFSSDGTMEVAKCLGDDLGWWTNDGLDFNYGFDDKDITHWMPLPEPPSP